MYLIAAFIIPIGFISLRQLRNETLSVYLRVATMLQILLLYSITVQLCFQEFLPTSKFSLIIFLQSVWQSIGLEYFFAKLSKYGQMKEEEAIRRRFGLGMTNSKKESRFKFLHSILAQQLFQAAYFFATAPFFGIKQENLFESFMIFYVGIFQSISLVRGLPLLIEGIVSGIKTNKESQYEETKSELEEEGLLWGRGLMAKRIQQTRTQKLKLHIKRVFKKLFQFFHLFMLVLLLSGQILFFMSLINQKTYLLSLELFTQQFIQIGIRIVCVIYVLYIGNEMIHRKRSKKRISYGKMEQEKLAAEGCRHLSRMISCSIAILVIIFPDIMIKPGLPFKLYIEQLLLRLDLVVIYFGLLVYSFVICINSFFVLLFKQ